MNERVRTDPGREIGPRDVRVVSTLVRVQGARVEALIGVYERERARRQPLVIDVSLHVRPVGADDLQQTFNYERVAHFCAALCDEHFDLIETFAGRLASACLGDPAVLAAEICVTKPEALASGIASVKISAVSTGDRAMLRSNDNIQW